MPTKVNAQSKNVVTGETRHTKIGKPKPAFVAQVQECELAMNLSYGSDTQVDEQGNEVTFFLWVTGDWKVKYKGKEYLIPMSENINALIEWINANERD